MIRSAVRLLLCGALACSAAWAAPRARAAAPAPRVFEGAHFALVVQGASGEEQYAVLHRRWLDGMIQLLRGRFKYDASHLVVLSEEPQAGEEKSTAEGVKTALGKLAAAVKPADQLVLILIGHGSSELPDAKFNLVGPDLTVAEWAALLKPIQGRVAVVDTTSGSFPFIAGLAAPGRVIITATNSLAQRYHTVFMDGFLKAFSDDAADLDKNGRISLLEAFTYASKVVKQHYEQAGVLATEVATIDDVGDGKGRTAAAPAPDGAVGALTYLDSPAVQTSTDPEVQRLLTRQQELNDQIDELRRKKATLSQADYDQQFEALVTELAQVSSQIRQKTGK